VTLKIIKTDLAFSLVLYEKGMVLFFFYLRKKKNRTIPFSKEKKGRPFYPYITLWVEHYSGLILNHHLAKPAECMSEFQGQFLKLAENYKSLPQEILVNKEETFKLLEPIVSELGIKLRRVKKLKMLEDAQASMSKFIAGKNEM